MTRWTARPISAPPSSTSCGATRRGSVTPPPLPGRDRARHWRPRYWPRRCRGCGRASALAAGEIGDRVALATWPNYHDPANFEAFTAADRRRRPGQRVRLQRGDARQAAGGRHRLGRLRADQLHDHRPTRSSASSSRSTWRCCPTSTPRANEARFIGRGHDRRQGLCRAEGLGHHRLSSSTPPR